jgi:hypothetical protein
MGGSGLGPLGGVSDKKVGGGPGRESLAGTALLLLGLARFVSPHFSPTVLGRLDPHIIGSEANHVVI